MTTLAEFDDPRAVLTQTRSLRKSVQDRHRRASLGDQLYQAYVTLFVTAPLIYSVVQAFDTIPRLPAAEIAALNQRIAAVLPIVLALISIAALRLAAWTGPVVVARADVTWLFSMPFPRADLIRPRLRKAMLIASVVTALPVIVATLPYLLTVGLGEGAGIEAFRVIATALLGGTAYGLGLVGVCWLIEIHPSAARLLMRVGGVAMVALTGLAIVAATGELPSATVRGVALWSGPWGWLSAMLMAAPDEPVVGRVPALLATALLIVAAVLLAGLAWRRAGAVPLHELTRRASTSAQVTAAAIYFADFRGAAQARDRVVRALVGRSTRRLPMPRRRMFLTPWIGMTVLMRQPRRIAQAVLWLVVAVAALHGGLNALADSTAQAPKIGLLLLPLSAGFAYPAAGILLEPLRIETEQRFSLRMLPTGAEKVGLFHLIAPAAILWVLSMAVAGAAVLFGVFGRAILPFIAPATLALTAVLTAAAAFVASGPEADGLWLYSGGPGIGRLVFHLLRGPLIAILAIVLPVLSTGGDVNAGSVGSTLIWAAAVAAGFGRWTQERLLKF